MSDRAITYLKKLPTPDTAFVIDFFCGCGGMSWGFANTRQSHLRFEILAGLDIDEKALATYRANISAPTVHQDIRQVAEDPALLRKLVPNFDPERCRPLIFLGCPPCQGFSAHRKKDDRDDPRNSLLLAFAKVCTFYMPDVVVAENVPEILTGRFRSYYIEAEQELTQAGYALTSAVVDLSLYGVPQRRRRAVVLGTRNSALSLPPPAFDRESVLTVRQAIAHLAPVAAGGVDPDDPCHRAPDHTPEVLARIAKTPSDGGDRRALALEDQLDCHTSLDGGETPGFTDVYGRLRWDAPSVTITAKCSTPSCGRFLHPEQNRNITVREAAILQGFPQTFVFTGPLTHQYRQIGEAVPPLFARFLAWRILNHLRPAESRTPALLRWDAVRPQQHEDPVEPGPGIRVVDSFCGAGGLSLGFQAAGFMPAFAFDTNLDCVATYNANIAPTAHQADVRDPDLGEIIGAAVANAPFVMLGGPPCQGFSQQRRGEREDARNNLVPSYVGLIERLRRRPLAVVFENVTYVDSLRGTRLLEDYIHRLEDMEYVVFRHDLHSADYGVPQLRRRVFIVALQPPFAAVYGGPQALTERRWPTIGEILADLPEPDMRQPTLLTAITSNHTVSGEGDLNKQRIAYVGMGQGRRAIPPGLQLDCHTSYTGHLDVYGRLDWFGQARTITGGFDSFTRGEFAHPFRHRSITPREAARIQGFPDWFAFAGNRASVRQQIGNAVPSAVAYSIACAIRAATMRTGD